MYLISKSCFLKKYFYEKIYEYFVYVYVSYINTYIRMNKYLQRNSIIVHKTTVVTVNVIDFIKQCLELLKKSHNHLCICHFVRQFKERKKKSTHNVSGEKGETLCTWHRSITAT